MESTEIEEIKNKIKFLQKRQAIIAALSYKIDEEIKRLQTIINDEDELDEIRKIDFNQNKNYNYKIDGRNPIYIESSYVTKN